MSDDFLSGQRGEHTGRRAWLEDLVLDARAALGLRGPRLALAARRAPPRRRVLVASVGRPRRLSVHDDALAELRRSRHELTIEVGEAGGRGKFENLNLLIGRHDPARFDWLLALDDDVELPRGFLDRFLMLAERLDLKLAQPAHRRRSWAAWEVTRRTPALARATRFVEIGPVTALHRDTFDTLLPFPPLRMGWGLDAHWAALTERAGWRAGIIDAVPMRHSAAIATGYDREEALAEARAFLAQRPYLPAERAQETVEVVRRL